MKIPIWQLIHAHIVNGEYSQQLGNAEQTGEDRALHKSTSTGESVRKCNFNSLL